MNAHSHEITLSGDLEKVSNNTFIDQEGHARELFSVLDMDE